MSRAQKLADRIEALAKLIEYKRDQKRAKSLSRRYRIVLNVIMRESREAAAKNYGVAS